MLNTTDYYLAAELAYRRERIARDWAGSASAEPRRQWSRLRLPRRPTLRQRVQRPRGAALS